MHTHSGPRDNLHHLDRWSVETLAEGRNFTLPEDKPHYLRDRSTNLTHIKVACRFDVERKQVIGRSALTVTAIVNDVCRISFDCADTQVSSVKHKDAEVYFEHVDDTLDVVLPEALAANESATIEVDYVSTPQKGIYFTGPDKDYPDKPTQIWTQGQDTDNHHWFPCIDEPKGRLTSEIICTVPKDWQVVSNGRLDSERAEGETKTFHWIQDKPHAVYLITLVAGGFSRVVIQDTNPIIDFYCEPGREEDAGRAFENTPAMIRLFEEITGEPYPWDKYSQVAVQDFIFGGMENTSATTQTDLTLHDEKSHKDFSSDFLVAHEAAHQWFGDLLTCNEWPHGWLNEGFATFCEALWQERHRGIDEYLMELLGMQSGYLAEAYRRPIVHRSYNQHTDIFDRHLYEKAGFVLHMLRKELGDDIFFTAVRHYVKTNKGRNVVSEDFQRAVEDATGRSMTWFFDQWLHRAGNPDFKVSYSWEAGKDDSTEGWANFSIEQSQEKFFRCSTNMWLHDGDKEYLHPVQITQKIQTVSVHLPTKPKAVMFDPGLSVIKTCEFKRPSAMLIHQLEHGSNSAIRIDAAKNLASKATPAIAEALGNAMRNDTFWGVQSTAADALGDVRTSVAKNILMSAKKLPNLKARRAVASALGKFRYDDEAANVLTEMLADGDSYYVSAAAAAALGNTRTERAFGILSEALANMDSHIDVVRCAALAGLGHLRTDTARELVTEWTRRGKPQRTRVSATAALGKLGEGHVPTIEHLVSLLDDDWFQLKTAAARSLLSLRADEAIPDLNRLARRDGDGRVVRTARKAVLEIQKGETPLEDVRKLREQVEKLQSENTTLKERLSKLEERL